MPCTVERQHVPPAHLVGAANGLIAQQAGRQSPRSPGVHRPVVESHTSSATSNAIRPDFEQVLGWRISVVQGKEEPFPLLTHVIAAGPRAPGQRGALPCL